MGWFCTLNGMLLYHRLYVIVTLEGWFCDLFLIIELVLTNYRDKKKHPNFWTAGCFLFDIYGIMSLLI